MLASPVVSGWPQPAYWRGASRMAASRLVRGSMPTSGYSAASRLAPRIASAIDSIEPASATTCVAGAVIAAVISSAGVSTRNTTTSMPAAASAPIQVPK